MKDNFKNYSNKKITTQRNKILLTSNSKQNKKKKECNTDRIKFETTQHSLETKKSNLTRIIKPNIILNSFTLKNSFSPIPKPKKNIKNKILVLDLDETLIHVSHERLNNINLPQYRFFYTKENEKVNSSEQIEKYSAYLIKRPYLNEFFNRINKIFKEIIIFTSSKKSYADAILKIIDEKKIISKCFYRNDCKYKEIGLFFKDLTIVNNNIHNVIIVDNNPNNFSLQRSNGLPISTFEFNENDKELLEISYILEKLTKYNDVRKVIPLIVDNINGKINYDKAFELFKNKDITLDYEDKTINDFNDFEEKEKKNRNNIGNVIIKKTKKFENLINISFHNQTNENNKNQITPVMKNSKIIYKRNSKKLTIKPNLSFRSGYQNTFINTFNDSKKSLLSENKSEEKLRINSSRNDSIKLIRYKPNILLIEKLRKNNLSNSSKKIKCKFINHSINTN